LVLKFNMECLQRFSSHRFLQHIAVGTSQGPNTFMPYPACLQHKITVVIVTDTVGLTFVGLCSSLQSETALPTTMSP